MLDHPYLNGTNEIGALSHLQMARAYRLLDEREASLKSYEEFLAIWHDADADLPLYQQAKAEYASVRGSERSRR